MRKMMTVLLLLGVLTWLLSGSPIAEDTDFCNCHYGEVPKDHRVEHNGEIRMALQHAPGVAAEFLATVTKLSDPTAKYFGLEKGTVTDLGVYGVSDFTGLDFKFGALDPDSDVCEDPDKEVYAKLKPVGSIHMSVSGDDGGSIPMKQSGTTWTGTWDPPQEYGDDKPGVYYFTSQGKIRDVYFKSVHEGSQDNDKEHLDVSQYKAKITLCAVEVKVTRKESGNAYSESAEIAVGGYESSVHKALVEFTLDPIPSGSYTISCPVSLTNAEGYSDDNDKAKLYVEDSLFIEGDGKADIVFENESRMGGDDTYLLSSNVIRNSDPCQIKAGSRTDPDSEAAVQFLWDDEEGLEFSVPDYFIPEVPDTCKFRCFLLQDVPIDLHDIPYYTFEVGLMWYEWIILTDEEDFSEDTEYYEMPFTDLPFGREISELMEHSATTEGPDKGIYANTQTVHDYFDLVEEGDSLVWREILVQEYRFAVYDDEVYRRE